MNPIIQFFYIVLYQPLLNGLILLYHYLPGHDFGLAVIILTILMKLALFPSTKKSLRSQAAMQVLQPKLKAIQQKYPNDRQKQTIETMQLYKEAKVSPASGCLPLLFQLPVLIALYQVFAKGLDPANLSQSLYSFTPFPEQIKASFLGLIDLAKPFMTKAADNSTIYYWPVLALALLAAVIQFIQSKKFSPQMSLSQTDRTKDDKKSLSVGQPDFSHIMQKQMLYVLPLLTIFIIVKYGSVIGLYWVASSLFGIGEYCYLQRKTQSSKLKTKATI